MSKKEERAAKKAVANTPAVPKKRFFNVEKRFGYTLHEMWVHKMSYAMVAPFFILFITFSLLPLIASLALSFTYWNIFEDPVFNGLHNYVYLFVDDSLFLKAFTNTLTYAVIVGPV
ncbi:MAG: sugar ABC transporter permease, partial [Clostridia bacterium]|nr:sugar ABC transporter permease [Clostridia bacterium]